jgi:hypothetical protein
MEVCCGSRWRTTLGEGGKAYMRINGKAAFQSLQKEPWLGLMIFLLGVTLIVLSIALGSLA